MAKHFQSCGSGYVSCIDCSKVFDWQTWEAHTSCVSEAQKYQGKLFEGKEKENKGQVKQDMWTDNVEARIADPDSKISPQTKALLEKLLGFSNIPRKQKPFANFVKNSLKIWDDRKIGEMWDVIFQANAKPAPAAAAAGGAAAKDGKDSGAKIGNKWAGWKRALDEELESSSGELSWQKLRVGLVAKYRASGEANGAANETIECMVMAEIPEEYLSRKDGLVRLPQAKKAKVAVSEIHGQRFAPGAEGRRAPPFVGAPAAPHAA
eukprot:CAMPEP_0183385216 /NCGR_PEP_ID=MMETSP0370-20130417/1241_1 /TAXON_ID=268820 /ORGANISM="Peridinium aciculiferum, Strain PAER-2" /LENGTH=263 /DNA_ID=CAMNT_0025563163 /DNA_START=96 /DNA_END=882 /DNA_ORIENTATION=+